MGWTTVQAHWVHDGELQMSLTYHRLGIRVAWVEAET